MSNLCLIKKVSKDSMGNKRCSDMSNGRVVASDDQYEKDKIYLDEPHDKHHNIIKRQHFSYGGNGTSLDEIMEKDVDGSLES